MIKLFIRNQNGFTLISSVTITVIISTLVLSLLSGVFLQNNIVVRDLKKRKLELLCKSAVELAKLDIEKEFNKPFKIEIEEETVFVEKRSYGLLLEITAFAKNGKDSVKLKSILGCMNVPFFEEAVTLSEANTKMAIAGSAKIRGDISISGSNITKGKIPGIENNQSLHTGSVKTKQQIASKIYTDSFLINLFNDKEVIYDTIITENKFVLNENSISSLGNKEKINFLGSLYIKGNFQNIKLPKIIHTNNELVIDGTSKLNSDLTFYSDSSITIAANSVLKNIVLISKSDIGISNNSLLYNSQVISKKGISAKGATFYYPSVIGLYVDVSNLPAGRAGEGMHDSSIEIESSVVNGSILLICSTTGISQNKSKIILTNSVVKGFIYSENYTEVSGSVIGSLYSYRLRYYKKPTEYINWLVNTNVNRDELDKSFLAPYGFKKTSPTDIGDTSPSLIGDENKLETLKEIWTY